MIVANINKSKGGISGSGNISIARRELEENLPEVIRETFEREYGKLFSIQVKRLLQIGYAKAAGMSKSEFLRYCYGSALLLFGSSFESFHKWKITLYKTKENQNRRSVIVIPRPVVPLRVQLRLVDFYSSYSCYPLDEHEYHDGELSNIPYLLHNVEIVRGEPGTNWENFIEDGKYFILSLPESLAMFLHYPSLRKEKIFITDIPSSVCDYDSERLTCENAFIIGGSYSGVLEISRINDSIFYEDGITSLRALTSTNYYRLQR